ncbi:MAG: hypothetical protein ACOZBH_04000 [Patescibacteria group bacterium]
MIDLDKEVTPYTAEVIVSKKMTAAIALHAGVSEDVVYKAFIRAKAEGENLLEDVLKAFIEDATLPGLIADKLNRICPIYEIEEIIVKLSKKAEEDKGGVGVNN